MFGVLARLNVVKSCVWACLRKNQCIYRTNNFWLIEDFLSETSKTKLKKCSWRQRQVVVGQNLKEKENMAWLSHFLAFWFVKIMGKRNVSKNCIFMANKICHFCDSFSMKIIKINSKIAKKCNISYAIRQIEKTLTTQFLFSFRLIVPFSGACAKNGVAFIMSGSEVSKSLNENAYKSKNYLTTLTLKSR